MRFPATLQFKPSRRLRAALLFVHLLVFASLLPLLPAWSMAAAAVGLFWSLWRSWRRIAAPVLILGREGDLAWQDPGGEPLDVRILAGATVFSWLVVLRVRLDGGGPAGGQGRVLVVLADSLAPADYRKLQVWLRWALPLRLVKPLKQDGAHA
jgi:hypothetical protein